MFDAHTFRDVREVDQELFATRVFDAMGSGGWLLRSGCWEIARRFYAGRLRDQTIESIAANPKALIRGFGQRVAIDAEASALSEWAKLRSLEPIAGIDWQDALYWEQRLAGWLAAVEQSLDLLSVTSIQPANCLMLYELLVTLPLEARVQCELQERILVRVDPALARLPTNPSLDHPSWTVLQRIRRKLTSLAADGGAVISGLRLRR